MRYRQTLADLNGDNCICDGHYDVYKVPCEICICDGCYTGHKTPEEILKRQAAPKHTKDGYLRDSQRRKLYRAEGRALKHHSLGQQYEKVADCQEFLMGIIERKTFKRWFPKAARDLVWRLEVRPGYGARRAFASGGYGITLPLWARNKPTMIHELCHLVVEYEFPRREVAWHGWQFCQTYLKIVGNVLGPEDAARLKAEFKAEGVRFTPPRKKREMTEADKQVLRDRLVIARAAKARKQ